MIQFHHQWCVFVERAKLSILRDVSDLLAPDTRLFEFWAGAVLFSTGVLFLLPGDSAYVTTPGWSTMRLVFTEIQAGILLSVVGGVDMIATVKNMKKFRHLMSYIVLAVFSFIAYSFFVFSPYGAWVIYAWFAIASFWALLRQGRSW